MKLQGVAMFEPDIDTAARTLAMQMLGVPCACRECGHPWSDQVARSFLAGGRCYCVKCNWYGNWRAGTILNKRHLSERYFVVLFSAFSLFRSPVAGDFKLIAQRTGLSVDSCRYWHRIICDWLQAVEQ